MKTFALIFSFYILFLAVMPSFVHKISKTSTCCHKKECCKKAKQEQQSKNSPCSKGNCTPFFGCTNIQVVVTQSEKVPSVNVIIIQKDSAYIEFLTSDFYSKSWHPPRFSV
jgi:hypothetical protein